MSTPIAAIVTASSSRSSVRLNAYVSNEKKGQAKGERFVAQSGVNGCLPPFEERQFRDNRKHWGKNGERVVERRGKRCREGRYVQAYHVIESFARDGVGAFNPENPDDWERAHGIGVALAKKIAGPHRMATVTTQIDGQSGCIHNHIVIDSIDKTTGRSFDSSNVQHRRLAAAHDELLASLGYRQVNKLDKGLRSLEKGELREAGRHAQWQAAYDNGESATGDEPYSTAVLRRRIEDTLADTSVTSFDTFIDAARVHGVDVRERGSKGGITYTMLRRSGNGYDRWRKPVPGDRRRASKLGRNYMRDAVDAACLRNAKSARFPTRPRDAKSARFPQSLGHAVPRMPRPALVLPAISHTPVMSPEEVAELAQQAGEASIREFESYRSRSRPRKAPTHVGKPGRQHRQVRDEQPARPASVPAAKPKAPASDVVPIHGIAEAPQAMDEYRSELRDVHVDDAKKQKLIDRMVQFDEYAVSIFERGRTFADGDVPKGIGPVWLNRHGGRLDGRVCARLLEREAKKARASELMDAAGQTTGEQRDMLRGQAKALRSQIAQGDYALEYTDADDGGKTRLAKAYGEVMEQIARADRDVGDGDECELEI